MSEVSTHTCPQCGSNQFFRNNTPAGLVPYEKGADGKPLADLKHMFPVRPWFCKVCNYVELKYENPVEYD